MDFLLFNIFLLVVVIFLLVMLSWIWPPDSPWAPWWRTNKTTALAICRLAKITKKDVVYDLGCGDAEVLVTAAKEHGAKGIGIEIDPLRVFIARFRVWKNGLQKKITIKKKNLFDEDISKASVVIVYLVPKTLERLRKEKFMKQLKKGTRIVSFRYKINLPEKSYDKKYNLYLYEI